MEYHPMQREDYAACRALWEATPGVRLVAADSEERIAAFLCRNPGLSFVAVAGDEIAGTAMCGHDGRRGYVYHVAVAPAWRRRGVATELMGRCLAALREAGVDKCHVFVLADNELGNAFWAAAWARREDITLYSRDV